MKRLKRAFVFVLSLAVMMLGFLIVSFGGAQLARRMFHYQGGCHCGEQ